MHGSNESAIGVPWFDEVDWGVMRALNPDEFRIPYQKWRIDMTNSITALEQQGYRVRRLRISADDYRKWCTQRGIACDSAAWSQYVATLLDRRPT